MHRQGGQLSKINPFRVMAVMQRAAELEAAGRDIVHMEIGEPDFTTATPIIEAGRIALGEGRTRYTAATGIAALQERIREHYRQRHGVNLQRQQILLTPGASGGLTLLANLLVTHRDGILLSDPAYPCIRNFIHLRGAEPQLVPVGMAENFQPTVGLLARHATAATGGVWLASPANPTGTILERSRLEAIVHWSQQAGYHLLVDEIYHGLHYLAALPSVLELTSSAFVVNSFSKYFGMTGWRLGWIVVPESAVEPATRLAQNLYISASSIAQYAALAAFEPSTLAILEARRQAFRERRDFLAPALTELGFKLPPRVEGAFYLYADISRFATDAESFCRELLENHGVAITPGTDFGEHRANSHVRFAFTTGMDRLQAGVERLATALRH